MTAKSQPEAKDRSQHRLKLPAMYTFVRVKPKGHQRYCWSGHVCDISESGMRFELDSPLEPGSHVQVRVMLPGVKHIIIQATGRIVRLHDDIDERGPMRMAMLFDTFNRKGDHQRLAQYLSHAQRRAA